MAPSRTMQLVRIVSVVQRVRNVFNDCTKIYYFVTRLSKWTSWASSYRLLFFCAPKGIFYVLCTVSGCDRGNRTRNVAAYTWCLSLMSYGRDPAVIDTCTDCVLCKPLNVNVFFPCTEYQWAAIWAFCKFKTILTMSGGLIRHKQSRHSSTMISYVRHGQ